MKKIFNQIRTALALAGPKTYQASEVLLHVFMFLAVLVLLFGITVYFFQ
jgi:hypothetical protein